VFELQVAAEMLGGEVHHDQIICPGSGHSAADRSVSVSFDMRAADGFLVQSFLSDDFRTRKDYVRRRLGRLRAQPNFIEPADEDFLASLIAARFFTRFPWPIDVSTAAFNLVAASEHYGPDFLIA
jgi:hypothetical protein